MKTILTYIGILLTILSFWDYYRDIFRKATRPHLFTWIIWSVLGSVAFYGQIVGGGGFGSWVVGSTTLLSFGVVFLSIKNGFSKITKSDWLVFVLSITSILLWFVTKTPVVSIILVTLADVLGYIPTIRKSWMDPFRETLSSYQYAAVKFLLGAVVVDAYNILTVLYSGSLAVMSVILIIVILYRRKILSINEKGA